MVPMLRLAQEGWQGGEPQGCGAPSAMRSVVGNSFSWSLHHGRMYMCVCVKVLRVCRQHQHAHMGHAGMLVDNVALRLLT